MGAEPLDRSFIRFRYRAPMPLCVRTLVHRSLTMSLLLLSACNSSQQDDTTSADTDPTTTPSPTTTALPEPTTTSTSEDPPPTSTTPPITTTTTTTTSDPTTTEPSTDTDAPGLACPLDGQPGTLSLTLTPELFSSGGDPSNTPSCKLLNPERGFHGYTDLRDLSDGDLEDIAADGHTVVYGQVLIPEYRDKPLDDALLAQVDAAFTKIRDHGMKAVPRFHYSDGGDEPDAELDRILEHIDQLAPLLNKHADVILLLHAGFIGAYGEWHSSQNGLDAPGPRKAILDALLTALPAPLTIGVRRPSFKNAAYGEALTEATAHDDSARARIGHINDCFLASDDDEGTYQEPGEKDYAITDSLWVPVGGETCGVNPPRSECPAALDELALHHWTHLNAAYHPDVLTSWQQDGCYNEIACRLGYRLAALALQWPETAAPGAPLPISFNLINDGYAAPANPRPINIVFDGPTRFTATAAFDLRKALPGEPQTICTDTTVPANAPPGDYRIGLHLPDPALADDPRQSIHLSNEDLEWTEGINWFNATLTIE